MTTAIIALSSGLDCVTSLAIALSKGVEVKQAIFFDYGQRAAKKEEEHAKKVAEYYNIPFEVIELPFLKKITKTALVNKDVSVPEPPTGGLDAILSMQKLALQVWVSNRNGVIVNILGAYADSFEYDEILVGWNAEEGVEFSDNLPQCAAACTESLTYTTQYQPVVKSYVQSMNRMEIVHEAIHLSAPIHLMWSCYHGEDKKCGNCESCKRFRRAFEATGNWEVVKDRFEESCSKV